MKRLIIQFAVLCALFPRTVLAEKLMLAHVAINPSQGMLHLAKDSGILAKYGFTADVILILRSVVVSGASVPRMPSSLALPPFNGLARPRKTNNRPESPSTRTS